MKLIFASLVAIVSLSFGQTAVPYPLAGNVQWHQTLIFLPNSSTAVTTSDTLLGKMLLANTTGGALTVTLTDTSTNCSAGVCQFWPTISIAANTVYENDFGGMFVKGGVKWQASAATSVVGYIRGTYTTTEVALSRPPSKWRRVVTAFHREKRAGEPSLAAVRQRMEEMASTGLSQFPK